MFERSKKAAKRIKRLIAVAAVPTLSVLALALVPQSSDADASEMYVVNEDALVHVDDLTREVFLTDGAAELISRNSGNDIRLLGGQNVSITYQGETVTTVSYLEDVSSLLRRMDIHPSPLEMVSVAFLDELVEITIASEFIFYEHDTVVTPYETEYRYNYQKPSWHREVIRDGQDGVVGQVYEIIYQDGAEVSRHLIDSPDSQPVNAIIEVGTLDNFANNADPVAHIQTNEDGTGAITLENGQVVTFSQVRTMTGTAYTAYENPYVDSVTATGTLARVGVVAVDRKQIPLGTKVYVVSNDGRYTYGFAIAEDTGVRGNVIDLYYDTYQECVQFGRRACTVYILD